MGNFEGMTRRATRFSAAVIAALLLAGCGSRTDLPQSQSGDGQPANFQLVTDIPIPSNATMDNGRSLILSDRDRWTGRVVMKLWHSANDMVGFYQQQMPAYGWEPVMSVTSETSVLSYTRGDRAATVQIDKASVWGSTVSVTVAPRQAGGAAMGGGGASSSYDIPAAPRPAPVERVRAEPLGKR